jgi:predicted site-specific integrase-resolvase
MSSIAETKLVSDLAEALDCFTEEELTRLAGIKASTAEAWRKRGTGPSYIRFGNQFLYPRAAVKKHLEARMKDRRGRMSAGLL